MPCLSTARLPIRKLALRLLLGVTSVLASPTLSRVHAQATPELQATRVAEEEPSLLVVDDLRLDLLLREPTVANPLYLTFDERGRLWVVQYRQYPWPAGLKLLSRDSVWRNVYDPPFAPPPPHASDSPFRGLDTITIHEDTDGDGRFDQHKTFLDGLNFATAALPGRGGVFVMNPPYLLFYADRDRDDRPDSLTPRVLLSGFGIEDSHSIANSLRWGPDGWIYAAQGSTVSGSVVTHAADGSRPADAPVVHSLGQNIWRYHPERHQYEIFAEGGGNAFGVEIDQQAHVFSGHNGGDTRGFHYVQGGYWQKNFGKHGQLSNPYAFDYHQPMRHHPVVRFTHTFTLYEADQLPGRYHGLLFGVNPVEHTVVVSRMEPDGSSRRTSDLGIAVQPGEGDRARWFTPVDIQAGPDGALYVADWYSVQPNHYRNHEGQTNPDLGRIYRLRGPDQRPVAAFDMAAESSAALIDGYLFHPQRWYRETARRLLGDRRDPAVRDRLVELMQTRSGQQALEAFWALHVSGGLDAALRDDCLSHDSPLVRRAALHLLGDEPEAARASVAKLVTMAREEPDVEVRCQLAATAKRLDASVAVPVVFALAARAGDAADIYLPKTVWWSLEAHADDHGQVLRALERSDAWESPFRAGGLLLHQNLMRRYALSGSDGDLRMAARLMGIAPTPERRAELVQAFAMAYEGRPLPTLPEELARQLERVEGPFALLVAVRRGNGPSVDVALAQARDPQVAPEQRIALLQALADTQASPDKTLALLRELLAADAPARLKSTAIAACGRFSRPDIGPQLLSAYATLPAECQEVVIQTLASRQEWAANLIEAIAGGQIDRQRLDDETVSRLRRHEAPEIQQRLAEWFPQVELSVSQREARLEALETIVRSGQGAPLTGRELFHGKAGCGKCHRLFTQGADIGPDLTAYNRSNLRQMLLAVAHPSAEIREGFGSVTVATSDGRVLSGLKLEDSEQLVIVRGTDGVDQRIPREEVEELTPNTRSLMPEGLLDGLSDEEIRHLFAYLSSTTPPL